ncbi:MAG: hypothetical protein HFE49_06260 [Clostridia bacterium]|nr:hypothetical protein [Clostridia bacterium]
MTEFCKECFFKAYDTSSNWKIVLSKDLDFCEECGMMKPIVIKVVHKNLIIRLKKKLQKIKKI